MRLRKSTGIITGLLMSAFLALNPIRTIAGSDQTAEPEQSFFQRKLQEIEQIVSSDPTSRMTIREQYDAGTDKLVIVLPQTHYIPKYDSLLECMKEITQLRERISAQLQPFLRFKNLPLPYAAKKAELEKCIQETDQTIKETNDMITAEFRATSERQYGILAVLKSLKQNGIDFLSATEFPFEEITSSTLALKDYVDYHWDENNQEFRQVSNGQPISKQAEADMLFRSGAFCVAELIFGDKLFSCGVEDPVLHSRSSKIFYSGSGLTPEFIELEIKRNKADVDNLLMLLTVRDTKVATVIIGENHIFPKDYAESLGLLQYLRERGMSYIVVDRKNQ